MPHIHKLEVPFYKSKFTRIEEGDVIMFPSFIVHRAPKNNSQEQKTIVSFNSCVGIGG